MTDRPTTQEDRNQAAARDPLELEADARMSALQVRIAAERKQRAKEAAEEERRQHEREKAAEERARKQAEERKAEEKKKFIANGFDPDDFEKFYEAYLLPRMVEEVEAERQRIKAKVRDYI